MAHADVHPVLASTSVSEDARDITKETKKFYNKHHTTIGVGVLLLVTSLINRSLVRRELTRLQFSVEIVPEGFEDNYFDRLMDEADSPD